MSEFFDALGLIVLIIDFVLIYRLFYPGVVHSKLIALMITTIVTFLLILPYPWFAWLIFFALFLYGFFGKLGEQQW